jgi:hypothetical protein
MYDQGRGNRPHNVRLSDDLENDCRVKVNNILVPANASCGGLREQIDLVPLQSDSASRESFPARLVPRFVAKGIIWRWDNKTLSGVGLQWTSWVSAGKSKLRDATTCCGQSDRFYVLGVKAGLLNSNASGHHIYQHNPRHISLASILPRLSPQLRNCG